MNTGQTVPPSTYRRAIKGTFFLSPAAFCLGWSVPTWLLAPLYSVSPLPEPFVPPLTSLPRPCPQEQQALVFQMMQQIQQKRELQRLQMTSASQLSMTSLLAATSAPLHSSTSSLMTSAPQPPPSSSSLLASLSPQQLNPSNALLAPQATPPLSAPANSLLASGTGIPPVLTAQTNPFLNLQPDGNTPKGTVRMLLALP